MITKIIFLLLGLVIGKFKRENLLYFALILYALSTATITGTGISVYTMMNWSAIFPLFLYLIYDGILLKGFSKKNIPNSIYVSIVLLFFYILVRYLASTHPNRFNLLVTLFTCFVTLISGMFYFDEIKIDKLLNTIRILILFEVVLVIGQSIFGLNTTRLLFIFDFNNYDLEGAKVESLYRAVGTFNDPNYYALFMCVLSSAMLIRFKPFDKLLFLFSFLGTILSFSRMGVFIAGLLLIVFLVKALKLQTELSVFYLAVSLFAIGVFIFFVLNSSTHINILISKILESIRYRFLDIYDFDQGGRIYIIQAYFNDILSISNLIFGLGFENFEGELQKTTGQYFVAHNEYIQVFADIGIIGVALIAACIFLSIKNVGRQRLATANPMFFSLMVIGLGNLFLLTTFNIYIYFFIALYIGHAHAHKKRSGYLREVRENGGICHTLQGNVGKFGGGVYQG